MGKARTTSMRMGRFCGKRRAMF